MPTSLEQHESEGFPDAGVGAVGLRATLTEGYGGLYLTHVIDAPGGALHTRFLLGPGTATGGAAHLAGGWASSDIPAWWVSWDAVSREVSLTVPGSAPIIAVLPDALVWHSIEAAADAAGGTASLRVNGVLVGEISGAAVAATEVAWLGVLAKSRAMAGTLDLDDWVLDTVPIGVRRVEPSQPHAGDPTRWLVVYNTAHADGAAWAEHYRAARGVPYANLCGLLLPTDETISAAQYHALRDAVLAYLSDNGLADQVVGVLLGLGVPGYVDYVDNGHVTAAASLLHSDASNDATHLNALHRDPPIDRPSDASMPGLRFTGRVDGATLAEAVAWVDRATALMQDPPRAATGGGLWLDPVPEGPGANPLYTGPMLAWAQGDGLATLRLPIRLTQDGEHTAIDNDAVFWGWGQASPPAGFFASPAGRRAVCVQLETADPPASVQRNVGATHWARRAFDAGYAAAGASSRGYTLSALPQPGVFFEALRLGWTLAEAWLVCQPFVRSGMQLIGDPLMTVGFPKAGYDVFGPASGLEAIDTDVPALRLPENALATALTDGLAPPLDATAVYLVRRVDAVGRSDGGSSSVRLHLVNDEVTSAPLLPAWPDAHDWPARAVGDAVQAVAVWAVVSGLRGLERIALEAEEAGGAVEVLWEDGPPAMSRVVCAEVSLTSEAQRLRWRLYHEEGAQAVTPWSAPVAGQPTASIDLPVYEVQP